MKYWQLLLVASVVSAGVGVAQGPGNGQPAGRPDNGAPRRPPMMMMRRGHRGGGGERDQVALLLDKQLVLQLNAQQVSQLITIHQQERQQAKPLMGKMLALMPKDRDGWKNLTPAQRDSMGSIREQLREIQWRQVSAASAVLTDDQKKTAARLTDRPRWGGRGGMAWRGGQRGPGGPGGPGGRGGWGGRPGARSDSTGGSHE
jgi:hypothetical protein